MLIFFLLFGEQLHSKRVISFANRADLKVSVGSGEIPIDFVRNSKARRYIIRMVDGVARVTIPWGGNLQEAWEFAQRSRPWLEKQLAKKPQVWGHGTIIFLRGEPVELRVEAIADGLRVTFGEHALALPAAATDPRAYIERYLARIACTELVEKTRALSLQHEIPIRKIAVKDQRSRWGSCSARRTISLNWRLIQTPPFVQEYIIIHELMHLREMNHSHRFWAHVAQACPAYLEAEKWLRKNAGLLR